MAVVGTTGLLALTAALGTGTAEAAEGTFTWTPQWMDDNEVAHEGETLTLTDPVGGKCYKLTGYRNGLADIRNNTDRTASIFRGSDNCGGSDTLRVGANVDSLLEQGGGSDAPEQVSVRFWTR
jgi:hypothetical protein